ncbi:MAG: hypothetical protein OXM02_02175, partial [Bacteroidota bacterium]|nr:hypothetical protein [Bacteroidota bacterium]
SILGADSGKFRIVMNNPGRFLPDPSRYLCALWPYFVWNAPFAIEQARPARIGLPTRDRVGVLFAAAF